MSIVVGFRVDAPQVLASAAPAYSPLTAFGANLLFWGDALDAATMWQDTAMTVPANMTDNVGGFTDKSGNGNHLTQATASAKPARSVDGMTLDGGDFLSRAALVAGTVAQPYTAVVVATITNNSGVILASAASPVVFLQRGANSTTLTGNAGASLTSAASPDLATKRALYFEANGASSKIYVNGAQIGSTGNAGANVQTGMRVGVSSAGTNFVVGDFGEVLLINRIITAPEMTSLQAYFAGRHGV